MNSRTGDYQCDICEATFDESHPTCPKCTLGQLKKLVTDGGADIDRDIIVPDDGISLSGMEILDDEDTVGIVDYDVGEGTVHYENARAAFCHVRKRRGEWEIGDEESNIFISSDGGELNVSFGPEFAPIETSINQGQFELATNQFGGYYPEFDLYFDDSGLVVFDDGETAVAVAPMQWPWDKPHTRCGPRAPGGPTV